MSNSKKIIAIDCETSSKPKHLPWASGFYLACVGLIESPHDSHVYMFNHKSNTEPTDDKIKELQQKIDSANIIIGQNIKYDINILKILGVSFDKTRLWDTMIAQYLINGQERKPLDLGSVATGYGFSNKIDKVKNYWNAGIETYDIPENILKEYVLDDCQKCLDIYIKQLPIVIQKGLMHAANLQFEFSKVLSDMECTGIYLDREKADDYVKQFKKEKEKIANELLSLFKVEDINLNSKDNMSALLFGGHLKTEKEIWFYKECTTRPYTYYRPGMEEKKIKYPGIGWKPEKNTEYKKGDVFSTDKKVIEKLPAKTKLQKQIKKKLLEYSEAKKKLETLSGKNENSGLINKIYPDGLLHTNYNQAVTRTGRLSSSSPNSQNLPRTKTSPIRKIVISRFDGLLNIDLKQIEWHAAAVLSQDPVMLKEINSGMDRHAVTGKEIFKGTRERVTWKGFNFGIIYGKTAYGFYKDHQMPNMSLKNWKGIVNTFYKRYSGLKKWQDKNKTFVYKNKGWLQIPTGRIFKFVLEKNNSYNENKIANYPVQGTVGGDVLPLLATIIWRRMKELNFKSRMILTVHDNIVFEYKKEELERLIKLIETAIKNLPFYIEKYFGFAWTTKIEGDIEIGQNYGAMQKWKK